MYSNAPPHIPPNTTCPQAGRYEQTVEAKLSVDPDAIFSTAVLASLRSDFQFFRSLEHPMALADLESSSLPGTQAFAALELSVAGEMELDFLSSERERLYAAALRNILLHTETHPLPVSGEKRPRADSDDLTTSLPMPKHPRTELQAAEERLGTALGTLVSNDTASIEDDQQEDAVDMTAGVKATLEKFSRLRCAALDLEADDLHPDEYAMARTFMPGSILANGNASCVPPPVLLNSFGHSISQTVPLVLTMWPHLSVLLLQAGSDGLSIAEMCNVIRGCPKTSAFWSVAQAFQLETAVVQQSALLAAAKAQGEIVLVQDWCGILLLHASFAGRSAHILHVWQDVRTGSVDDSTLGECCAIIGRFLRTSAGVTEADIIEHLSAISQGDVRRLLRWMVIKRMLLARVHAPHTSSSLATEQFLSWIRFANCHDLENQISDPFPSDGARIVYRLGPGALELLAACGGSG
jgi:hypothetical protein